MKINLQLAASGEVVSFCDEDAYLRFCEKFDATDRYHQLVARDCPDPLGAEMDRDEFLARLDRARCARCSKLAWLG